MKTWLKILFVLSIILILTPFIISSFFLNDLPSGDAKGYRIMGTFLMFLPAGILLLLISIIVWIVGKIKEKRR